MKKIYFFTMVVLILVMCGCHNEKDKTEMPKSGDKENMQEEKAEKNKETLDSGEVNWNDIKIKNIGYFPRFMNASAVVQNNEYIFYPFDGNRIIRIDKMDKSRKEILKIKDKKKKYLGARLHLTEDSLFIEYADEIYKCDHDGNRMEKLLSGKEFREKLAKIVDYAELGTDDRNVRGLQIYKEHLYIFTSFYHVLKVNLVTKEMKIVAKNALNGCFYKDSLYYVDYGMIYRIDLVSGKRHRFKGNSISGSKGDSNKCVYYDTILTWNGCLYYTKRQKGGNTILYMFHQNKQDSKIYEFDGSIADLRVVASDSEKVYCEYSGSLKRRYLQVYDIELSHIYQPSSIPYDFETTEFIVDDTLFYYSNSSSDDYLKTFSLVADKN